LFAEVRDHVARAADAMRADTAAGRPVHYDGVFDPDLQCTHADRVRCRQPGDKTLGLSPHMDTGTVERWIDRGTKRFMRAICWPGDPRRPDAAWPEADGLLAQSLPLMC
jgi:hypothetical protein